MVWCLRCTSPFKWCEDSQGKCDEISQGCSVLNCMHYGSLLQFNACLWSGLGEAGWVRSAQGTASAMNQGTFEPPWHDAQVVFSHTHIHTHRLQVIHSLFFYVALCLFLSFLSPVPHFDSYSAQRHVYILRSPGFTRHAPQKGFASYTVALLKHAWPGSSAQISSLSLCLSSLLSLPKMQIMQESNKSCMLALL